MNDQLFNELKQKYDQLLMEEFERNTYYKISCRWMLGVLLGVIGIMFTFLFANSYLMLLVPLGVIIVCIILAVFYGIKGSGGDRFAEKYMTTIVADLLSQFYTDVNCCSTVHNSIVQHEAFTKYTESCFEKSFDMIRCSSKSTMKYNGYDLTIYDLCTIDAVGENEAEEIIFKGLFGVMKLNHSINGKIFVNKNNQNYDQLEKVNVDYISFDKEFKVLASDKVKAMQLLTHDVMEKILDITNSKSKFEFRIIDDKLYCRVFNDNTFNHDGKELFDRKELNNDYINAKLFRDIMDIIEESVTDNNIIG